jgi:hypothetical protein
MGEVVRLIETENEHIRDLSRQFIPHFTKWSNILRKSSVLRSLPWCRKGTSPVLSGETCNTSCYRVQFFFCFVLPHI